MTRQLTVTLDEEIYEGLHQLAGSNGVGRFIESLVRPRLPVDTLDSAYEQMAADEPREAEALEWAEATVGDASHETR